MSLEHAFDLWDWTTVFGLVMVGLFVGYSLLPYNWPYRRASGQEYPVAMALVTEVAKWVAFFTFLIAWRYASGMDRAVAAKTIGTAGEGLAFALAIGVGLHFRAPHRNSTSLDDIAVQLADIKRLAAITSQSAEDAHLAASAADDRVISQAERQVDDRTRAIRIEDVAVDTNHRAQDIQERLP